MVERIWGLSSHARVRCQQRCVSSHLVALVVQHADSRVFVGDGVQALMVTRKRLRFSPVEEVRAQQDRLSGLIVLRHRADGAIVTVMRAGKRSRRYLRH